jgi:ABC-type oligopeptide transport system substrate-binding subunit
MYLAATRCWLIAALLMLGASPDSAADPNKILHYAFQVAETSFDPVQISDLYSSYVIAAIFEAPLTYDYLARPFKLRPNLLESMPEVSDDGKTYLLRFRQGIFFRTTRYSLVGYQINPVMNSVWQYVDIDLDVLRKAKR